MPKNLNVIVPISCKIVQSDINLCHIYTMYFIFSFYSDPGKRKSYPYSICYASQNIFHLK